MLTYEDRLGNVKRIWKIAAYSSKNPSAIGNPLKQLQQLLYLQLLSYSFVD